MLGDEMPEDPSAKFRTHPGRRIHRTVVPGKVDSLQSSKMRIAVDDEPIEYADGEEGWDEEGPQYYVWFIPESLRCLTCHLKLSGHDELEAVTEIDAVPPEAVALRVEGLIANEHAEPNCVTVWISPLTVMEPVRAADAPLTPAL